MHILYLKTFSENLPCMGNVGKYGRASQVTDDNKMRRRKIRFECRIAKARIHTLVGCNTDCLAYATSVT